MSLAGVVGLPPLGGLEWITAATDGPAQGGTPTEIAFSGEAGILAAAPDTPDLLDDSDSGVSNTDNLTNLDNSAPEKTLHFSVGNTIVGATVTLYADGVAIGSAVADSATTTVTTNGNFDLVDGVRSITARQTAPGEGESTDSAPLEVTIDTVGPILVNPAPLGGYDTSGEARGVTVVGTLAYVADGMAGLQIIDVSDPAAPVRVGGFNTQGSAEEVAVCGTLAYVADGDAGLVIIDVANPAVPVQVGGYDTAGHAYDIAVSGTVAYIGDGAAGLQIIDVTNPASPALLGGYVSRYIARGVAVSGTTVYVAGDGALEILDVRDAAAPVQLDLYGLSDLTDVAVSGTLVYATRSLAGLVIIDVSDPAAPVQVGVHGITGTSFGVAVSGTRAYVANAAAGLQVIDIANPASPARLGGYNTSDQPYGEAYGVAVSGTLAYVANGRAGLRIIDVSSSTSPAALDLQPASDTGISKTDNITTDTTPTFNLPAAPGSYFRVLRDGVQISGDWETGVAYTTPIQPDGTYAYSVLAVDAAGNVSTLSPPLSVTIDTSIPLAPDLLAVSDTGISNADNITNLDNSGLEKTLQFTVGNTIAGATVTLYADGMAIGSAVAVGTTTTVTTNGMQNLTDGIRAISARQTLPGGPESTDSATLKVTIDTVAPRLNPVKSSGYDTRAYAFKVAVSGTLAYVAYGVLGLAIYDVTNAAAPVRVGGCDTADALDVAVVGTLAYVADNEAGLVIIDVTNPATPVRLGGYDTTGHASCVAVYGTLAYVADDTAGLVIIDVTNPAVPRRLGAFDIGGHAGDVAVSGTVAYVTGWDTGLVIIDITNPAKPARLGGFVTGGYARDLVVVGTLAYVIAGSAGLQILDVSDPATPVRLGAFYTSQLEGDVAVVGSLAYVGANTAGLVIVDVTNPSAPVRLGEYDTSAGAGGLAVSGTTAYVAGGSALAIIDVTNPAAPVQLGSLGMLGSAYGVAVSGTIAYVANWETGLVIVDVADPAAPVRLGIFDTDGAALRVVVSGTTAYVLDDGVGLVIIDVTNPAKPVRLGGYNFSGYASDLTVVGTLAYVANSDAGLAIIDATNPAAPVWLGGYDTTGHCYDVAVSGTLAYLAQGIAGLTILDVANPAAPVRLGGYVSTSTVTTSTVTDVAVVGTLAYIAGSNGLEILDVTNPAAPVRLGRYFGFGGQFVGAMLVSGTTLYVADQFKGLYLFDVSDPTAPVQLAQFVTYAYGVVVSGSRAYVANPNAGLEIIDLNPAPDLQAASDTGMSNTDNITADNTPTFDLAVQVGSYFRFYRDGVQLSGDYESGTSYSPTAQTSETSRYTVAVVDAAGNVSSPSSPLAVTVDTTIPRINNVLVGSTHWTETFLADLNVANGQNVAGYSIPVGSGQQLAPLAWGNIDQIKVVFNEQVIVDKTNLRLSGANTASYDLTGATFSYDPATFTATWNLASPITADKLEMRLNSNGSPAICDPLRRRLDGEWTNPTSPAETGTDTYPSGNGAAGGDFVFRFRTLPCDANQDGAVDIFDIAKFQVNYGADHGMTPADGDFDGNGTVDIFDVALLQVAYGSTLESPAPMPAGAPGAGSTALPLVAAQPGHSPAQSSEIVESLGGRVSGPPEAETLAPQRRHGVSCHNEHLTRTVRSTARRGVENVRHRGSGVSPFPRALAVHDAAENVAWASAVDEVLERAKTG